MQLHAIAGTPRSGSTLLCNILNQNPRFHASSTSCVPQMVKVLSNLWSKAPEVKSDLIRDAKGTEDKLQRTVQSAIHAWYEDAGEVVFDKGRLWNHMPSTFRHVSPEGHIFVCVRDLKKVFASVEKQYRKTPLLNESDEVAGAAMYNRANGLFSPQGLIGQAVEGIEDLSRRQFPFVHFIQFETLVRNPQLVIGGIYGSIGEEPFEHDFENVENTATDVDGLYLNKFPHQGCGKVTPPKEDWHEYVSSDIAALIKQRFPLYHQAFNY